MLTCEAERFKKLVAERSDVFQKDTSASSSRAVIGISLDTSRPVSAVAADILAGLQRDSVVIDAPSIATAIYNCLQTDAFSHRVLPTPNLKHCLCALNAQLQRHSVDERSVVVVLQCCSHAQSYSQGSIDAHWLASTLLSVCTICTHDNCSSSTFRDFVESLCRNLANFAGCCDHRSVTIIRAIAAIASFLRLPTLLYECFCVAFIASPSLNVIPSLLFNASCIWPVPFSKTACSGSLISLFVACIFDVSTQAALSESEAAHAVAFLHTICAANVSFASVAEVVPCCVSNLRGADVSEAYIACKFAVSVLDSDSIWSSIASPILSLLQSDIALRTLAHKSPAESSLSQTVHGNESLSCSQSSALASTNATSCIILLGHAISAIVQQSELLLHASLVRISPAVEFLFSISFLGKPPCSILNCASPMSLPPAEAASVCLHEVITHACNASHCISPECDYDSIEKLELLWIELLSFPKTSLDSGCTNVSKLSVSKRQRHLSNAHDPN